MKTSMVPLVASLVLFSGCGPPSDAYVYDLEWHQQQRRAREQWDDYDRQTKRVDEQLAKSEEQDRRFDTLLDKWEEQALRYDAIMEAMERQHGIRP